MNKRLSYALIIGLVSFFLTSIFSFVRAQSPAEETQKVSIDSWLLLGPFVTPLPALHKEYKKGFAVEGLLHFNEFDLDRMTPKAGESFRWHNGEEARWTEVKSGEKGLELEGSAQNPSVAYLAAYIDTQRWTSAKVTLQSPQVLRLCLDGHILQSKTTINKNGNHTDSVEGGRLTEDLKLETGKHLILVKTVFDPESNSPWLIKGTLTFDKKYAASPPRLTLSASQHMTITHLLDGPKVADVSISPDGKFAALTLRQSQPPSDDSESWMELREAATQRLVQTFRGGMSISSINWAPQGKKFSYTTRDKSGATVWIVDLETGESTPILKDVKDLGFHVWSPDASYLIYSMTEKGEEDREGVKRLKNLADRQPGWRNRSFLYKISLPEGVRQRLTAGEFTTSLNAISPDGKKLLFSRSLVDYAERPFARTQLFLLDLQTLDIESLWEGPWFGGAQWAPKGGKLLILGGPSVFGDAGVNVPKGMTPNEYDTQAYLFDIATKEVEPLTRDFAPSVSQAVWSRTEEAIYFIALDRAYRVLYRFDLVKKEFERIDCGVEVMERFALAENAPAAVFTASSASTPPKAFLIDLAEKKVRLLADPGAEDYSNVEFGRIERWAFKNKKGYEIDGRVYYPPNFDPSKQYPCIVYYYGGTSPVTRDFGGRYPKNLWAAQGYVVYVLQPSGATGFGQAFSAFHVNDWGFIAADEIIDGVKKFLSAHRFVDPKRVGCIGASYGGFMTMLLLTRTNMFAAAVAHAGISSISSYWGEGYWGYAYSAIASADSYPWNRKDIYVNQSPLFSADKIATPLLLLHGSEDTNVPPGESTQLYTALKILGREVEYIQVADQNHHIMTYNKRILWTKTIMAWFDRWLKGEPEWWQDLFPN